MAEKANKNLQNLRSGRVMTKTLISTRKECYDALKYMTSLLPFPDESIKALVHYMNKWEINNIDNMIQRIDMKARFVKKVAKLVYKLRKYNQLLGKAQLLHERFIHPSEGVSSIFKESTIAWVYSVKDLSNKFNELRNNEIPSILEKLNKAGDVSGMWDVRKTQAYMRVLKGSVKERQEQTNQAVTPLFVQKEPMHFDKITRNNFLKSFLPTPLNFFLPRLKNNPAAAYAEIVGDASLVVSVQDDFNYMTPQIKRASSAV